MATPPPPESLSDRLMGHAINFQVYIDKQWWGPYFIPAITILGSLIVFANSQREMGKAQAFAEKADRAVAAAAAGGAGGGEAAVESSARTTGKKGAGGGGGVKKRK